MNFAKSTPEKVVDEVSKRGMQVANGIENAVDTAHDVAQDTLASVSGKLEAVHSQAKPTVDRLVARGEEIASNVLAATRETGERTKKAVSRYAGACESYVTEQPMKSVAIAAAAGATIAALVMLSRNRSAKRREHFLAR
jgi:ElaB/YqjD/DUF883 family membrane-anchored ribosome-binding protein